MTDTTPHGTYDEIMASFRAVANGFRTGVGAHARTRANQTRHQAAHNVAAAARLNQPTRHFHSEPLQEQRRDGRAAQR